MNDALATPVFVGSKTTFGKNQSDKLINGVSPSPGVEEKNSNMLDGSYPFNCELKKSDVLEEEENQEDVDKYWTDKKDWADYIDEEGKNRAKLSTRHCLDNDLKFCEVEKREEKITEAFQERMKDLENSRILFIKEGENGTEYKVIKQTNRFMKSNKNMRRRFHKRFQGQYAQGVFLTLTTWDKKFRNREEALIRIWADFHKFKTALDLYRKNRSLKKYRKYYKVLDYLAVLEFNKNGYPHLHICFLGIRFLTSKEKIKELWYLYHQSYIIDLLDFRGVSVFAYITKYFDKFQDLPDNLKGLMWYGRKRFYNLSRALTNSLEKKKDSGYVFVGCVKKDFEVSLFDIFKSFKWTGISDLLDIKDKLRIVIRGSA